MATMTSTRRSSPVSLRLRRAGVLCAILTALAPSVALADARTEARRHFRRGMELVVEGQIDAGVAELEEAYNILPHPNVLYNIGRAYAEVGRYADAREYFDRYLESDPPDREEVRAIVAAIDARIAAREAAATQPTTPTTTETTGTEAATEQAGGLAASAEQLETIDAAIAQVASLCAATGSAELCEREQRLRAIRASMAAGLRSAPTTETGTGGTETGTGTDGSGADAGTGTGTGSQDGASADTGSIVVGASRAGDAAYTENVDAAARQRSTALDAPASTTIITRQDIRLSGVTQVGELLRRAAGVTVMTPTPAASNVSIRGFNRLLSARVLMLVNGRTTYFDPLGTPMWESQPLMVEDIERIEVIRGPASVLYGANGFTGIVNVVLRTPGADAGTEFSVGVGNARQARGHVATSGRVGDLSYRLASGYQQYDRYARPFADDRVDVQVDALDQDRALQTSNVVGQLRYRASDDITFNFEGGVNYIHDFNFYATGAFLDFYVRGPLSYVSATMQTPYGRVRTFLNRASFEADVTDGSIAGGTYVNNTFDVEAEFTRQFHLVVDHDFHLGVNYRLKHVDWTFTGPARRENHAAVFLEDTMKVGSMLRLVGAVRMDYHPLLPDLMFSPRGAVIVRPTEAQSIRLTAGTAFRTPSMQDTYVDFLIPTPVAAVNAYALGSDVARDQLGRRAADPEKIVSVELGYLNQENDYIAIDASLYYNRVSGLLGFGPTNELRLVDFARPDPDAIGGSSLAGFDAARNAFVFGDISVENEPGTYHQIGGEVGVRTYPVDGLDLYANYAYNYTLTSGGPHDGETDTRHPQHMLNVGAQYRSDFGLDLSTDFHYSTATVWPELVTTSAGVERRQLPSPSYMLLNARIAYRLLDDKLEIGFSGTNITGQRRPQHPSGQPVDTRLLGTLTARF